MKATLLLYFLFYLITSHPNANTKSHSNLLRHLWDESMNIPTGRSKEEESSLKRCSRSNYKYFSYVLSGSPVSFDHTTYTEGSVSLKYILI